MATEGTEFERFVRAVLLREVYGTAADAPDAAVDEAREFASRVEAGTSPWAVWTDGDWEYLEVSPTMAEEIQLRQFGPGSV